MIGRARQNLLIGFALGLLATLVGAAGLPADAQADETADPLAQLAAPAAEMSERGPALTWAPVESATGYDICRKRAGGSWEDLENVKADAAFQGPYTYTDGSRLFAGTKYSYRVRVHALVVSASDADADGQIAAPVAKIEARNTPSVSLNVPALSNPAPRVKRSKGAKKMEVTWTGSRYADGYTVEYSASRLFSKIRSRKVEGENRGSATIKGLSPKRTYYVRVRAYQEQDGKTARSYWGYSANARAGTSVEATMLKVSRTVVKKARVKVKLTKAQYAKALKKARAQAKAKRARLKKPKKYRYKTIKRKVKVSIPFELAGAARQKLGTYDILQGGCSDGKYAYFVLNHHGKNNCRIVKVRLEDRKVIKVSGVLDIGHGNDITYDSKAKRLVVAQGLDAGLVLPIIDPVTLKLKKMAKIEIPDDLPGASESQLEDIWRGMAGIAYDAESGGFVTTLSNTRNMLFLDSDLKPFRYVTVADKGSGVRQAIDIVGRMLVVCESPGKGLSFNQLRIYDLEGASVRTVRLKGVDYELEHVFSSAGKLYASSYRGVHTKKEFSHHNYVYRLKVSASNL